MQRLDIIGQTPTSFRTLPYGAYRDPTPFVDVRREVDPFPRPPAPAPSPSGPLLGRVRPGSLMFAAIDDYHVRAFSQIPNDRPLVTILDRRAKFGRLSPPRNLTPMQQAVFAYYHTKPDWYVFSQHVSPAGPVHRGWIKYSAFDFFSRRRITLRT